MNEINAQTEFMRIILKSKLDWHLKTGLMDRSNEEIHLIVKFEEQKKANDLYWSGEGKSLNWKEFKLRNPGDY